jgi:hypothetical protein
MRPGLSTAFHWSFFRNAECFGSVAEDRMRKLIIAVILILAATAVFATARQDTKPAAPMIPPMPWMMGNAGQMRSMMQNSPMNIPGVEVAVTDTPDGVTVSFTTKTGDVTELRRLVRQHVEVMKNMHNSMATGKQ